MKKVALLFKNLKSDRVIRFFPVVMIWFAAWFFLGIPGQVQAEPYLRVNKNGVIYYYFDNKEINSTPQSFRTPPRFRVKAPLISRKLAPQEIEALVQEASRSHNVPPSLVKAVIRVESNFNPSATSPKGAQGLMQLMPGTADDLLVANPYDPGKISLAASGTCACSWKSLIIASRWPWLPTTPAPNGLASASRFPLSLRPSGLSMTFVSTL